MISFSIVLSMVVTIKQCRETQNAVLLYGQCNNGGVLLKVYVCKRCIDFSLYHRMKISGCESCDSTAAMRCIVCG